MKKLNFYALLPVFIYLMLSAYTANAQSAACRSIDRYTGDKTTLCFTFNTITLPNLPDPCSEVVLEAIASTGHRGFVRLGWRQTSGIPVTLRDQSVENMQGTNNKIVRATYTAPDQNGASLRFRLEVRVDRKGKADVNRHIELTQTLGNLEETVNTSVDMITLTSARLNATVKRHGLNIVRHGFVYSPSPLEMGLSMANFTSISGSNLDTFKKSITDLTLATTYYYKAYTAPTRNTGSLHWNYTEEQSFTTLAGAPVVNTTAASQVTATSVTLNGNITSNGGEEITERGFLYSLSNENLIIDDAREIVSGTETGAFSREITGLTQSTLYYYRAYAINSLGTRYADIENFTTSTHIPDANFRRILFSKYGVSTNSDNTILSSDVADVGTLEILNENIQSLSGIEAFRSLTVLDCRFNSLTELDVSKNTDLTQLRCNNNSLAELDVSKNMALLYLECSGNRLMPLLNVSKNTALTYLDCSSNSLTELDVSKNMALTVLGCNDNSLSTLNVKNGNNGSLVSFSATGNSNLTCIQVDDASNIPSVWAKDTTASYSNDCSSALSNEDFEKTGFTFSPNPTTGILNITAVEKADYRLLNIKGQVVKKGVLATGESKIDVSPFAKGIYLLNIKTDKGSFTKKVVKRQ